MISIQVYDWHCFIYFIFFRASIVMIIAVRRSLKTLIDIFKVFNTRARPIITFWEGIDRNSDKFSPKLTQIPKFYRIVYCHNIIPLKCQTSQHLLLLFFCCCLRDCANVSKIPRIATKCHLKFHLQINVTLEFISDASRNDLTQMCMSINLKVHYFSNALKCHRASASRPCNSIIALNMFRNNNDVLLHLITPRPCNVE